MQLSNGRMIPPNGVNLLSKLVWKISMPPPHKKIKPTDRIHGPHKTPSLLTDSDFA